MGRRRGLSSSASCAQTWHASQLVGETRSLTNGCSLGASQGVEGGPGLLGPGAAAVE